MYVTLTRAQYNEFMQRQRDQAMEISRLRQLLNAVPFYIRVQPIRGGIFTVTGISCKSTMYELCAKVGAGAFGGPVL